MALIQGVQPSTAASGGPARVAPGRSSRVSERTVLLVASFGALLAFLDVTIVNVAFPSIQASFADASIESISWVLNAYNIVFAAFLIVFGRLGDLVGRRRLYLAGIGLFTLASLVSAMSTSVMLLVVARVVQALGAAMLVPASLAVVIEGFPKEKRSRAVGLWGAAAAVAAGLGPPVGGALVEAGGWRWAFWINLPLGMVALWLARRFLVESRAPGRRRIPDLVGALLLAGALGLTTTAIIRGSEWGPENSLLWVTIVGALVLFAGFGLSSRRHPSPVLDLAMMRARPFLVANLATFVGGIGFFAYMLTNVLWLQYVWHYTVLQAGLALAPAALVAAVVAGLLEPIAAKHGYRWIIVGGFVVWALGFYWYVHMLDTSPGFLTHWLPGQVLSGMGVGATLPLLGAASLATQPGDRFGTASAVISSARQVGGTIGLALLVVILGTPTAATVVRVLRDGWTMSLVCFLAGGVITLFLGRVRDQTDEAVRARQTKVRVTVPAATPEEVVSRRLPPVEESLSARLPSATRGRIVETAPRRLTRAGDWLVRTGDTADAMFVLVSGRAEVVIGDEVVRELGPGSVIGELALLTGDRRSASVRARRDCSSLEVSRALMDETIAAEPAAMSALVTALAGQLGEARPPVPVAVRPSLIAVVGATPDAPAAAVAAALRDGLTTHVQAALFLDKPTHEEIDRAERDNERVIVVATGADPDWTARCAREADAVVLVGRAGEAMSPALPPWSARPELVLVGRPMTQQDLRGWSTALDPWRLTLVDEATTGSTSGLASSLQALVDRLAGRSLGLVLGGGGRPRVRAHRRAPRARGGRDPGRSARRRERGLGHRRALRNRCECR